MALEAQRELVQFARHRPRMALLLRPLDKKLAEPVQFADGCWLLQPSGLCDVEVTLGRAQKPATCRLFPFNRLFDVGDALIVDFNSRVCPLQDVAAERSGQGFAELSAELSAERVMDTLPVRAKLPQGAAKFGWQAHEGLVRDAIAQFLEEPDYATFAAFQEEAVVALAQGKPPPAPGSAPIAARAERLRETLLSRWRTLFGASAATEPALAAASRAASRQAALLTGSWRLDGLLRESKDGHYTTEIQRLPRSILATSFLLELGLFDRARPPGLRAATETRLGAFGVARLLAFFDRRARVHAKIPHPAGPPELHEAIDALSAALRKGDKSLGDAVTTALAGAPPELRGLAFAAFANGDAQLEIT